MDGQGGTDGSPALAALRACRRLAGVPDGDLRQAAVACYLQTLEPGQAVYRWGQGGRSMFLVESGRIASRIRSWEGQVVDVGFAGPGDMFGYFEIFDGGPRDSDAVAVEASTVLVVPHPVGLRLLAGSTPTLLDVVGDLLSIVRQQTRATGSKHFDTVPVRLAGLLLELVDGEGQVLLGGPQSLLAHRLGTARQTLNRALRSLSADGLIAVHDRGRRLTILDRARLEGLTGR